MGNAHNARALPAVVRALADNLVRDDAGVLHFSSLDCLSAAWCEAVSHEAKRQMLDDTTDFAIYLAQAHGATVAAQELLGRLQDGLFVLDLEADGREERAISAVNGGGPVGFASLCMALWRPAPGISLGGRSSFSRPQPGEDEPESTRK